MSPDFREYKDLQEEQAGLALEIEGKIAEFLRIPRHVVASMDFQYIDPQIMTAEAPTWQGRRDAFDIVSIFRGIDSKLVQAREETEIWGQNRYNFSASKLSMQPESVLVLFRQQKFNWQHMGETVSEVSLEQVLAAADRCFYILYRDRKSRTDHEQRQVDSAFVIRDLIKKAILIDNSFKFNPTDWQDIVQLETFIQLITNRDIVDRKRQINKRQGEI